MVHLCTASRLPSSPATKPGPVSLVPLLVAMGVAFLLYFTFHCFTLVYFALHYLTLLYFALLYFTVLCFTYMYHYVYYTILYYRYTMLYHVALGFRYVYYTILCYTQHVSRVCARISSLLAFA